MIDRSFGKFIIIVLLATTVHQTAICFSLIYFVYPIKISKKYLLMTVIGSVAIILFFLVNFLFSRALALLNLSKFEKYIINGENGGLTFFFFILTFVLAGSLLTVQERNNPKIKLFYHMMILALVIQSFSLTVAEFARVTQYFFLSFSCLSSMCHFYQETTCDETIFHMLFCHSYDYILYIDINKMT